MAYELAQRKYVRYDSGVSKIAEGEAEDIQTIKGIFDRVIHGDHKKHGHTYPTTHARTLGIVKGKLVIPHDLPAHLKQGPFAQGGEYALAMRYNVGGHDVTTDAIKSPGRGLTIKVFNLPGERFPEGTDNTTQDFSLNSQLPVSELSDARTAREMISILERAITDPTVFKEVLSRPDRDVQLAPAKQKRIRVEAMEFYSQFAYRFGDYVAKFGLFPVSKEQTSLADQMLPPDHGSADELRDWIREYYSANEAVYDWKFQLCENLDDQPVEYAGKEWNPTQYPYQTVARIIIPIQDSADDALLNFWADNMRLNAWRGLRTLEPLGGSNRVRRVMYPFSKSIREGLNPSQFVDVQRIEELPGPIPKGVPLTPPPWQTTLITLRTATRWLLTGLVAGIVLAVLFMVFAPASVSKKLPGGKRIWVVSGLAVGMIVVSTVGAFVAAVAFLVVKDTVAG